MFGLRSAQSAPAAAVGCAAAQHPCGAAGSGAGESATRLTQAEGEIDTGNMLAVRQHGVPVERLGLEPGSPLLASLKQKVRLIKCRLCDSTVSPWTGWVWSRGVRYSPHSSRR